MIVHEPVPQILEETVELPLRRFWTARFVVKTAPRSGISTEATVTSPMSQCLGFSK